MVSRGPIPLDHDIWPELWQDGLPSPAVEALAQLAGRIEAFLRPNT